MALCITAGKDSLAYGICCVAIGDNCKSFGAFQVITSDELTLSPDYSKEKLRESLALIRLNLEAYKCMEVQKYAPLGFYDKVEKAITPLISKIEAMLSKEEKEEKS